MSSSVEALLHDVVGALIRNGEDELASALARLLAGRETAELELPRRPEVALLADEVFQCTSLGALHALLPRLASALGVSHCTVHCVRERGAKLYGAKVLTTYPDAWATEYVARWFSVTDPVMMRCQQGPGTFFWDELDGASPNFRDFFEAAAGHGIGPAGITFVSDNAHGNAVAVSLASTGEPGCFRRAFGPRLSDFDDIAALVIEVFAELAGLHDRPTFGATDDQLEVLRALVRARRLGEAANPQAECAAYGTVETSILATFGASSLIDAAKLAGRAGLLGDVLYFKEDLFAPGQ